MTRSLVTTYFSVLIIFVTCWYRSWCLYTNVIIVYYYNTAPQWYQYVIMTVFFFLNWRPNCISNRLPSAHAWKVQKGQCARNVVLLSQWRSTAIYNYYNCVIFPIDQKTRSVKATFIILPIYNVTFTRLVRYLVFFKNNNTVI